MLRSFVLGMVLPSTTVWACSLSADYSQYDGEVSKSMSGTPCQKWSSSVPHVGKYLLEQDDSFCRNPDGDPQGPWCYTSDPDTRWEYCDVGSPSNPWCNDDDKANSCVAAAPVAMRIVGGSPSGKRELPFLVSLQTSDRQHFCGGALIANRWVISAAHCNTNNMYAVMGAHSLSGQTSDGCLERIRVRRVIVHPEYGEDFDDNDIMLLELATPSSYAPIRNYFEDTASDLEAVGALLNIAGWGMTSENGDITDVPHKASVPVYNYNDCNRANNFIVNLQTMICAGYRVGGVDSCQGDSGGPLFGFNADGTPRLVGITSFGSGCARARSPGVYTKVSAFKDFVCDTTDNAGLGCVVLVPTIGQPTTLRPTLQPTKFPTKQPTKLPTKQPTNNPTKRPTKQPTQQPTPPPSVVAPPTFSSTLPPTLPPTKEEEQQLDFSGGCGAGSGSFTMQMKTANRYQLVGLIPADKTGVRVSLQAENDLDIQLHDIDDNDIYREGRAVVAWCRTPCNLGVLNKRTEEATNYKGMAVTYSGYGGVEEMKGNEFVDIRGSTSVEFTLGVLAFEPGAAMVSYSWEASTSGCCMGTAPCDGRFLADLGTREVKSLGEVPVGKKDVVINLKSDSDMDIQLVAYEDMADGSVVATQLIGYCGSNDNLCDRGLLGNNDGTEETLEWGGRMYTYSGYDGVAGEKGHEWVRIAGVTNVHLEMRVYGFRAGIADVTYEFFEVPERA